jgi:zinc transporter
LNYLGSIEMSWFNSKEINQIRELIEKYIRYLEEIDSARDRAAITHEEINSIYSEHSTKLCMHYLLWLQSFYPLVSLQDYWE